MVLPQQRLLFAAIAALAVFASCVVAVDCDPNPPSSNSTTNQFPSSPAVTNITWGIAWLSPLHDGTHVANDVALPLRIQLKNTDWRASSTPLYVKFRRTGMCSDGRAFQTVTTTFSLKPADTTPNLDTCLDLSEVDASEMRSCWGDVATFQIDILDSADQVAFKGPSIWLNVVSTRLSLAYLLVGSFSAVSCISLIVAYFWKPEFREFPANLVFYRALCDLLFAGCNIYVNAWAQEDVLNSKMCNGAVAFFTQLSFFGSLCWYFVMALNNFLTVRYPFQNPSSRSKLYHAFAWAASLTTAAITASNYGYREDFKLCWHIKTHGINPYNLFLAHLWIGLFWAFSIFVLSWTVHHLFIKTAEPKPSELIATRLNNLIQSAVNVGFYSFFWAVAGVCWLITWYTSTTSPTSVDPSREVLQDRKLAYALASLTALTGCVDAAAYFFALTIIVIYKERARRQEEEEKAKQAPKQDEQKTPKSKSKKKLKNLSDLGQLFADQVKSLDLSSPLRKEFIFQTQLHIQHALLNHMRQSDPNIDAKVEANQNKVQFESYHDETFSELRRIYGVTDDAVYLRSFEGDPEKLVAHFSEGASGSFFYFTADRQYLVKTVTDDEFRLLDQSVLREYLKFWKQKEGQKKHFSLLCQFYGLYKLCMYHHTQYFVVMRNVNHGCDFTRILRQFDLKGSSVNRKSKLPKDQNFQERIRKPVLKDTNLDEDKLRIVLPDSIVANIHRMLEEDASFMASQNIMDYSLLITLQEIPRHHGSTASDVTGIDVPTSPAGGARSSAYGSSLPQTFTDSANQGVELSPVGSSPIPSATPAASLLHNHNQSRDDPIEVMSMPSPSTSPPPVDSAMGSADGVAAAGTESKVGAAAASPASTWGLPAETEDSWRSVGPFECTVFVRGVQRECILYVGIIDVLQEWNMGKRAERFFKGVQKFKCCNLEKAPMTEISAVPPPAYRDRFIRRLAQEKRIFVPRTEAQSMSFLDEQAAVRQEDLKRVSSLKTDGSRWWPSKKRSTDSSITSSTSAYEAGGVPPSLPASYALGSSSMLGSSVAPAGGSVFSPLREPSVLPSDAVAVPVDA